MSINLGEISTPVGTLRCSLRAWKTVNAYFGNYVEAFRRLAAFDVDAYLVVAAAGLGDEPKSVEGKVYDAGMVNLTNSFSEYVSLLSNGGRPVKDDEGTPKGEA